MQGAKSNQPVNPPLGREHPDHPLTRNRWEERPFRPAKTPAGWIAYGEVPSHIRMDCQNQERLTGAYPAGEAAATAAMFAARYVESEEDRIGQSENSSGGSRPRRFWNPRINRRRRFPDEAASGAVRRGIVGPARRGLAVSSTWQTSGPATSASGLLPSCTKKQALHPTPHHRPRIEPAQSGTVRKTSNSPRRRKHADPKTAPGAQTRIFQKTDP